eukprot:TRINITY_DN5649_c0_g1_i1.p1 TRINITY_DN5649_c0_g1~~TRINITY_DN5649_c0_g1_i1.p1  ORF type:complete len:82 (+),score=2.67 TRINITY_DN5649_c0_g1_i1:61-306(+)
MQQKERKTKQTKKKNLSQNTRDSFLANTSQHVQKETERINGQEVCEERLGKESPEIIVCTRRKKRPSNFRICHHVNELIEV